jgi:hypothetical protein
VMEKMRPSSDGSERLTVRGTYAAIRELHGVRTDVRYELDRAGESIHLENVQWADWDIRGRLLVATDDGRLQIRDVASDTSEPGIVEWEVDEGALAPDPTPPPPEAADW